jgi:hypothetical protein
MAQGSSAAKTMPVNVGIRVFHGASLAIGLQFFDAYMRTFWDLYLSKGNMYGLNEQLAMHDMLKVIMFPESHRILPSSLVAECIIRIITIMIIIIIIIMMIIIIIIIIIIILIIVIIMIIIMIRMIRIRRIRRIRRTIIRIMIIIMIIILRSSNI